ncbi:transketolase [Candidatus Woesearchaeota archaeon]|nr:transketolase [Candidatus Woesearchaeota archaeon]
MKFPIDMTKYKPLKFSTAEAADINQLKTNIQVVRDGLVFMTALANAKGLGGHTGGAYDIVPEVVILDALKRAGLVYHYIDDAAGHRVAIQYMMAALDERFPKRKIEDLFNYREFQKGLFGHPELDLDFGISNSSGRLGHLEAFMDGVSEREKVKVAVHTSDGSLMEGDAAEAARYAVARNLNVLWLVDDNNVTIEGHPQQYMKGYEIEKTLNGQGFKTFVADGENVKELLDKIVKGVNSKGPVAIVVKRKMAPSIPDVEGTPKAHDVVPVDSAVKYLEQKGYTEAVKILKEQKKLGTKKEYSGSTKEKEANRSVFGKAMSEILKGKEKSHYLVNSIDLGGSCGLNVIGKDHPEIYRLTGVMERCAFSVAAGFGNKEGYHGVAGTFSAFSEMLISEIRMAALNKSNVLFHFSHAGVDDMCDNTSHFGINIFFVDCVLPEEKNVKIYFPADAGQMKAVLRKVIDEEGLRFVFSTRSSSPQILKEDGTILFGEDYEFSGKDEVIRDGEAGYIVSYGSDMLYRSLDAVEKLKNEGIKVGLINKPLLNVVDEEMLKKIGSSGFVLVVEAQNEKTGLGSKMGSWFLKRGFTPRFDHMGVYRPGMGGLQEQITYQGLEPEDIVKKVKEMI